LCCFFKIQNRSTNGKNLIYLVNQALAEKQELSPLQKEMKGQRESLLLQSCKNHNRSVNQLSKTEQSQWEGSDLQSLILLAINQLATFKNHGRFGKRRIEVK
jgi:hypothetical protein